MKRIIAIMLAMVMLLSFNACKNNNNDDETQPPQETVSIDVEVLKADWQNGVLYFPNDKNVQFPCTVNEFVEKSGLKISNADIFSNKDIVPQEEITLNVAGEGLSFRIKAKNTSKESVKYLDATIFYYSFNNTTEANRQIKFAGTLSPGATRIAVEEALGIPEGRTEEDSLYIYNGRNEQKKKVKLTVAFNSYNITNSVAYEISL